MIAIVTATLDWPTAQSCALTWLQHARNGVALYIVGQKNSAEAAEPIWESIAAMPNCQMQGYKTPQILGVVPAFALGVQKALEDGHEIIACLHDDVEILDPGWDTWITMLFRHNPQIGLCGFGGGIGLGDSDIYQTPYNPMQLARRGFVSNMRDANAHGARRLLPVKVACLDGFSQIGRRAYWQGHYVDGIGHLNAEYHDLSEGANLFQVMETWGIVHHCYDAALGCFCARLGWECWMLPVAVHHYGGRTAVGNPDYQAWAREKNPNGDAGFWEDAHRIVYDQFRDVLPLGV